MTTVGAIVFIDDKNLINRWDENYLLSNNGTKVCQHILRVLVH